MTFEFLIGLRNMTKKTTNKFQLLEQELRLWEAIVAYNEKLDEWDMELDDFTLNPVKPSYNNQWHTGVTIWF